MPYVDLHYVKYAYMQALKLSDMQMHTNYAYVHDRRGGGGALQNRSIHLGLGGGGVWWITNKRC
jgi:hypothetical protein